MPSLQRKRLIKAAERIQRKHYRPPAGPVPGKAPDSPQDGPGLPPRVGPSHWNGPGSHGGGPSF